MRYFSIGQAVFPENSQNLQQILFAAYRQKQRPLCLCSKSGVAMYIANYNGDFQIKRMPNTGHLHTPDCEAYEPPPEVSGLANLIGTAIAEDPETGVINLRFDFALKRVSGKTPPTPNGAVPDSVKADSKKMTLLATLHYFWEQAQLNRWVPKMEGKRNWSVVRKNILLAASKMHSKGICVSDILYIPETFFLDRKVEISNRRLALFTRLQGNTANTRQLLMMVGEIKTISDSPLGYKMVIKHAPDLGFIIADDLFGRLVKRYPMELYSIGNENIHVIAIATFSCNYRGVPAIEEISIMLTSAGWLPFELEHDENLISILVQEKRRFIKSLRYSQSNKKPMATCILTDVSSGPVAMYAIPPGVTDEYRSALSEVISESTYEAWVWDFELNELPSLPAIEQQKKEDAGLHDKNTHGKIEG